MAKKRQGRKRGSVKTRSKQAKRSKKKHVKPRKKPAKHLKPKHRKKETFLQKIEEDLKTEEQLIFRKHAGKYKIPVGIKVLIVYLVFIAVLYLLSFFSGLTFPTTILFGQIMTGTAAVVINLVVLVVLGLMIYGFVKRKAYTFDLAIAWFGLGLLNSLVSFFLLDSSRFAVFEDLMFLSLLTLVVVNTLVMWYLLSEKRYFYAKSFHDRPWHHKDKVFVYTLVSFWVLVLLIGMSYAINFYGETTQMVDKTMLELGAAHPFFIEETCMVKEGKEKDVCLTVLATMYNTSDIQEISSICSNIESDFLRFTCLRSLK